MAKTQKSNQKKNSQLLPEAFDGHERLALISKIILWGLVAGVLFNFVLQGFFLHKDYPYNTFLFLPSDRYNDFYKMVELCKTMNPYFVPSYLFNSNYLPLANVFFWLFSFIPKRLSLIIFTLFYSAITYVFSYFYVSKVEREKKAVHKYAFVITFLNYAFIYSFDRANIEPYVVIPIMAFLFFYQKEKHYLAVLFLAIAAATKIYPFIFVILYVSDKKYKEVAKTVFYVTLLIVCPLLLQKGGFEANLKYILTGFEYDVNSTSFFGAFDDKGNLMVKGDSLFSVLKILNVRMSLGLTNMFGKYIAFVALVALVTILYVVLVEKSLWRKVTLLTCLFIMLPHISFDYKLLHLLFCLYLFFTEPKEDINPFLNYKTVAVLLGLILIPKAYFYFDKVIATDTAKNDIPMSTFVNPILMLILCFIIIKAGMKYYSRPVLKDVVGEHLLAIKKSLVFIFPVALLAIPYFMYSKKAKAEYGVYKEHYLKAQDDLKNNNASEAIEELKKSFEQKRSRFQLPLQIANIYNQLGNYDSAKVYYGKTLAIFPDCIDAKNAFVVIDINSNNAKGIENMNNKKYSEAIDYFTKTLDVFKTLPPNPANNDFIIGVYSNMFSCYYNLQNFQEAKNCLNQIEMIDPNNQFLKANKSNIERMLGQ